jgi:hypothetical protein
MNGTAIDASGLGGIPDIINQIVARFPVSNSDCTSNATLSTKDYDALGDTIAYLTSIGVPVFGDFWIDYDNQNPVSYNLLSILRWIRNFINDTICAEHNHSKFWHPSREYI